MTQKTKEKSHKNKPKRDSNRRDRRSNRHRNHRSKPNPNRLSEHFSKKDFACKQCDKVESCSKTFKISLGLVGGLELLRSYLHKRIEIDKAYICPEASELESKIRRNFYATGVAADIHVDGVSIQDVFIFAEKVPEFKGIGLNIEDGTVHVDTRKSDERALWVEEGGRVIDITEENRAKYFPPKPDTDKEEPGPKKETPKQKESSEKELSEDAPEASTEPESAVTPESTSEDQQEEAADIAPTAGEDASSEQSPS